MKREIKRELKEAFPDIEIVALDTAKTSGGYVKIAVIYSGNGDPAAIETLLGPKGSAYGDFIQAIRL